LTVICAGNSNCAFCSAARTRYAILDLPYREDRPD
jgi:hypothetical protein